MLRIKKDLSLSCTCLFEQPQIHVNKLLLALTQTESFLFVVLCVLYIHDEYAFDISFFNQHVYRYVYIYLFIYIIPGQNSKNDGN